jgi:uncharacterized cupin superfamily protein
MRKVHLNEITEEHRMSPKGKYDAAYKQVSVALGRDPESLDMVRRHPFDLTVFRVPPEKFLCPYHSHSAQWELYVVISGRGAVRHEGGIDEVVSGDAFLFGPGEAHQISNPGPEDFCYYVIADNPVGESCHYPDSGKWAVDKSPGRGVVTGVDAAYFDGEE